MDTPRGRARPGLPPRVQRGEAEWNEGLTGLGSELCSLHWEACKRRLPPASQDGRSSLHDPCAPETSNALQTEEKGLPVGQEGVRAQGCGTGSGSLRGAGGWAVLPSCMPASRGHGLQKRMTPVTLSSRRPSAGGGTFAHSISQMCRGFK